MSNTEFRDLLVASKEEANVIITGIPYDKGASCGKGTSFAPKVIRNLSKYLPPYSMDGNDLKNIKLFDIGDISGKDIYNKIESQTKELFSENKFKLFIGGDHSVSIPLEKNFIEHCQEIGKIPAIIHIDAHPDICDFYDDSSFSHACTNRRAIDNSLSPENLVLIGCRGFEEQEVQYFKIHPEIKMFKTSDCLSIGLEKLVSEVLNRFDDRYKIYLSYDIDANDPSFAPGTGTPESFGLDSIFIMKLIKEIVEKLDVEVMDIVEVSPLLDTNNITSWLALKTIYEVFDVINKKIDLREEK